MRKIIFAFIATVLMGLSGVSAPVMAAPTTTPASNSSSNSSTNSTSNSSSNASSNSTSSSSSNSSSSSSSNCNATFLGLVPWYNGLTEPGDCKKIKKPEGEDGIPKFITTIILNVLVDISLIIGYIAIAMVAWGGYLYLFSKGEVGRAEKGRKTLVSAVIGLVIALLASVIMRFFATVLIQ